jgi:hypothetical protein
MDTHVIERFRGLNLLDDEQEVDGSIATDLLNVELDVGGRLRRRPGLVIANSSTIAGSGYDSLHPTRLNNGVLLAGENTTGPIIRVDRLLADGTLATVGNWAASSTAKISSTADFGAPAAASYAFLASYSGIAAQNFTLQKYDGATIAGSTGKPRFVAISPRGNRLIQAHFYEAAGTPSGFNGTQSTVFFSDQGAPETFTATNFVILSHGDNEEIVGLAVWRDLIFVVKQTKMFVFYGESTDDEGLTEFNYHEVSRVPLGLGWYLPHHGQRPPEDFGRD